MNMVAIETFSLDGKLTTAKLKIAALHHCNPLVFKNSGNLAMLAAILLASSFVSNFAAARVQAHPRNKRRRALGRCGRALQTGVVEFFNRPGWREAASGGHVSAKVFWYRPR
jgi:hypothetical protein